MIFFIFIFIFFLSLGSYMHDKNFKEDIRHATYSGGFEKRVMKISDMISWKTT